MRATLLSISFALFIFMIPTTASASTGNCYFRDGESMGCAYGFGLPDDYQPEVGDRRVQQSYGYNGNTDTGYYVYQCRYAGYSYSRINCRWYDEVSLSRVITGALLDEGRRALWGIGSGYRGHSYFRSGRSALPRGRSALPR
jgi:hypothetical protein